MIFLILQNNRSTYLLSLVEKIKLIDVPVRLVCKEIHRDLAVGVHDFFVNISKIMEFDLARLRKPVSC